MQKLTSKFAAGLRPAATVSHTSCMTHCHRVSTVISYNVSETDVLNCILFICKNWLQNLPPDFVRLLLLVIHHGCHISKSLSTVFSHNFTKTDVRNCNLFITKNWLQNLPPDFILLLLWVIHHAIHISKGFQQWSATISPKQMLQIASCLYPKIDFKICRRTSSGC
jgi:hypothetical protein